MDLPPFKKADGEREFRVEVDILSRLDHPNLVSLIGYCADGKHRFLVYEYMQNGNLYYDHINSKLKQENGTSTVDGRVVTTQVQCSSRVHTVAEEVSSLSDSTTSTASEE